MLDFHLIIFQVNYLHCTLAELSACTRSNINEEERKGECSVKRSWICSALSDVTPMNFPLTDVDIKLD